MKRADHFFWQDYSEWDQELKEQQWEKRGCSNQEEQIARMEAYEARKRWYNEVFLKSDEWATVRRQVLSRAKLVCEACLSDSATEVHHTGYAHGSLPPLWELRAVCRPCHEKITFGWPMEKLSQFSVDPPT
jgi:5-methylcytosine-specific restriction endonuclease McrA